MVTAKDGGVPNAFTKPCLHSKLTLAEIQPFLFSQAFLLHSSLFPGAGTKVLPDISNLREEGNILAHGLRRDPAHHVGDSMVTRM